MSRKPAEYHPQNRVLPPEDLPAHLRAIWATEFAHVPAGHFVQSDLAAMVDLCRLVHEAGEANLAMVANRSRDMCGHWRACMALAQSARRALRLLPHSRQSPKRAGVLATGRAQTDGSAFDPPAPGSHDWRALFPVAATVVPMPKSKRRPP
ncbi:hypothetical protein ABIE51_001720 [Lysobacter sp. OAE881]|uniref:hypothetical protein n=1 Tax=Lysobacter sp. OAE881 TaxID=2663813 RepID=UPI0017891859